MEKNTVIMDLEDYKKLLMENHMMEERLEELNEDIIPSWTNEILKLDAQNQQLKKVVIELAIDRFSIEYYEEKDIIETTDFRFAISEEKVELLRSLGITEEEMIRVIKKVKEEFEATKGREQ